MTDFTLQDEAVATPLTMFTSRADLRTVSAHMARNHKAGPGRNAGEPTRETVGDLAQFGKITVDGDDPLEEGWEDADDPEKALDEIRGRIDRLFTITVGYSQLAWPGSGTSNDETMYDPIDASLHRAVFGFNNAGGVEGNGGPSDAALGAAYNTSFYGQVFGDRNELRFFGTPLVDVTFGSNGVWVDLLQAHGSSLSDMVFGSLDHFAVLSSRNRSLAEELMGPADLAEAISARGGLSVTLYGDASMTGALAGRSMASAVFDTDEMAAAMVFGGGSVAGRAFGTAETYGEFLARGQSLFEMVKALEARCDALEAEMDTRFDALNLRLSNAGIP